MERMQPPKADEVQRLRGRSVTGLIRPSEHEPEGRRQRSEFRSGDEGQINLQSAREEKYPVNPGAGLHVKMMQRQMPIVHSRGPIGEDIRQIAGIDNAKSEIDVRPPVFTFGRSRASDRSTTDAAISGRAVKEFEAQAITFFRRKHKDIS